MLREVTYEICLEDGRFFLDWQWYEHDRDRRLVTIRAVDDESCHIISKLTPKALRELADFLDSWKVEVKAVELNT